MQNQNQNEQEEQQETIHFRRLYFIFIIYLLLAIVFFILFVFCFYFKNNQYTINEIHILFIMVISCLLIPGICFLIYLQCCVFWFLN